MKKRKVIASVDLPTRIPLLHSVVVFMVLDHFHAPQWLWAAVCTLGLIIWVVMFIAWWDETPTRIFPDEDTKK